MANITSTIESTADVYRLSVVLESYTVIADPVAYVSQEAVYQEILSKAGLSSSLTFIAAVLDSASVIGALRSYTLTVTFDNTANLVGPSGHTHDKDTLFFPLVEAYKDGPQITLDDSYGPVIIYAASTYTSDFFRIKSDTDDLFYVKADGDIRIGGDLEFYADNTHDVGTYDGGIVYRRPRDLRLGRDLYAAGDGTLGGDLVATGLLDGDHLSFGTTQATSPSSDPTKRLLYWNSVDNQLHQWDGTSDVAIGPGLNPHLGTFTSTTSVQPLDAVYLNNPNAVDRAVATSDAVVIGFCVSKTDATTAVVQFFGELGGWAGALIPEGKYYLSDSAGDVTAIPGALASGSAMQLVGVAKDVNTLIIMHETPITVA